MDRIAALTCRLKLRSRCHRLVSWGIGMAAANSNTASNGWIAVLAVLGLLLMIGMCSSSKDKTAQSFVSPSLSNQIEAMELSASASVAPLDAASRSEERRVGKEWRSRREPD